LLFLPRPSWAIGEVIFRSKRIAYVSTLSGWVGLKQFGRVGAAGVRGGWGEVGWGRVGVVVRVGVRWGGVWGGGCCGGGVGGGGGGGGGGVVRWGVAPGGDAQPRLGCRARLENSFFSCSMRSWLLRATGPLESDQV
jgi:hypothetical protein